jgi:hypothetical protein
MCSTDTGEPGRHSSVVRLAEITPTALIKSAASHAIRKYLKSQI